MKVLIIDDEEMIRSLATKILEKAGFEAIAASTGEDGLIKFSQQRDEVALVLLDWTMPGMSGLDTLREIRKVSSDIPCVISSGHLIDESIIPEELAANTHFLEKPYRSRYLIEKVENVLNPT